MNENIVEALIPLAIDIDSLMEDEANARLHGEKNITAIKNSLERFGQRKPIVVQTRGNAKPVVRAGNGTLRAAKALGWEKIAVVAIEEDSVEASAFGIADNRTGELASWDEEVLGTILEGLKDDGLNLDDLGFDVDDLLNLDKFDNELDKNPNQQENEKYILELEFPDDQARKDEYEKLCAAGLIVRFK